ncbi:MAG TPA: polyhydroxyalkanoate synthesis regulator DNA-binding domain-containing protein [Rubricoccaceae bacterium]|jgi:polyhydroxyalkanoate synthesis repressor PhaR
MPRLIKRYGSRKLYDTTESRYVGLDDIAAFVRDGEDVRVVDNKSGTDVTTAILTQVISEEGRDGRGLLSPGFLHDLLRVGERTLRVGERTLRRGEEAVGSAVEAGLTAARQGVDEIARAAAERIRPAGPIADVRDEMNRLRERLESLESTLDALDPADAAPVEAPAPDTANGTPKAPRRRAAKPS